MTTIAERVFDVSSDIRYVATYIDGELVVDTRGRANASSAESDRYEELLVNPTVVLLTRQRGEIDCGGLQFVVVAYGSFFQLVVPVPGGHVSVAIELTGNPFSLAGDVRRAIGP